MRSTILVTLLVGSASAQPVDMRISIVPFQPGGSTQGQFWSVSAEFLSEPPSAIVQVWSDTYFRISGDGTEITIWDYNSSYDCPICTPIVQNGPTARFGASSNPFFNVTDDSNPYTAVTFRYDGAPSALELVLEGQNSAYFEGDSPFGDIRLYQDRFGNPGELSYEIVVVPAPGMAVIPLVALTAARRRRR